MQKVNCNNTRCSSHTYENYVGICSQKRVVIDEEGHCLR